MKVCTDACLFGALVADKIAGKKIPAILDIGTGTGLLSLMLAQQTMAGIDAVEKDEQAFAQARENFLQSPWKERLTAVHSDITHYTPGKKYDHIISNPPFFEADLLSPQQNKNAAKHDTALTLPVLLQQVQQLLSPNGSFAILLPYHRVDFFIQQSLAHQLYCFEKILVKQSPAHHHFRGILLFSFIKKTTVTKETTIKDEAGNYTQDFTLLLKDYYLHL